MPSLESWIVCESSGRWAAALRLAIARHRAELRIASSENAALHVREVRTIPELVAALREYGDVFPLVEVNRQNLAEVLVISESLRDRDIRPAALLDESLRKYSSDRNQVATDHDLVVAALHEAGFVEVVETPRQIGSLLELVARYAAAQPDTNASADLSTLAELAWAALPWQDA